MNKIHYQLGFILLFGVFMTFCTSPGNTSSNSQKNDIYVIKGSVRLDISFNYQKPGESE